MEKIISENKRLTTIGVVRGHSRSLEIAPFDTVHASFN